MSKPKTEVVLSVDVDGDPRVPEWKPLGTRPVGNDGAFAYTNPRDAQIASVLFAWTVASVEADLPDDDPELREVVLTLLRLRDAGG